MMGVAGILTLCFSVLVGPRAAMANPLGEHPEPSSSAIGEAALALSSPQAIDRIEAINRLAMVFAEDPAAVRVLLETTLEDPNRNVAIQSAAALARFDRGGGGSRAVRGLSASALGAEIDADLDTRRTLRLAALRHEQHAELDALAAETDPMLRLRAIQGLGELAFEASEPTRSDLLARLEATTGDDDLGVAAQARATLDRLSGRDPVPAELRRAHRLDRERAEADEHEAALANEDWTTRLRAVQALADGALTAVETERVLGLLAAASADRDPQVSGQAAVALERLEARAARLAQAGDDRLEED